MKKCNVCQLEKEIDCFTKTKYKGEIKYRPVCKKCTTERVKLWVNNNKDKRKKYIENYSSLNKESINKKSREYYKNNTEKAIKYSVEYKKKRRIVDDVFRISDNIRKLIQKSFLKLKHKKQSKSKDILGCSYEEFKLYLESQFQPWMNWDNYAKYNGELNYGWDIDHYVPISSAKTVEDVIRLNHYTNFQPLCSYTNRHIKRNKTF